MTPNSSFAEGLRRERDTWMAGAAMLLVALLLAVVEYVRLDERQARDLQTQAELIARTATAAVVFDNAGDARDILFAFERSPDVRSVQLKLRGGSELAAYERPAQDEGWLDRWAGSTSVSAEVHVNGETAAQLVVTADRGALWRSLLSAVGSTLAVMVIALLFTRLALHRLRGDVRAAEERTRYLAHHDPLTGLVNRASFASQLEQTVTRAVRQQREAALLCIDLDDFKQVNDSHGHGAGDAVLRAVAQRLRSLLQPHDVIARLGGDEFAVLLRSPADQRAALSIAGSIVERLPQPIEAQGTRFQVSVSVGVAFLPQDAGTPAEALHCADVALYQAKRNGKDSYAVYSPALGDARRQRLSIEQELRTAIAQGHIELAYQPIFDAEGRLASIESLARWRHPERGWITPQQFIPVAEESGLIVELGLAMLGCVRRDLNRWQARGLTCPPVALNLSSRQIRREPDRLRFLQRLQELGLTPSQVEFELTETSVFEDLDSPQSILLKLQDMGYTLAIDDFGTGYSSLAYLRRIKCRKLKIDRLFVSGVSRSDDAKTLIESIVRVAHAMDMRVVAEGVESASDQEELIALGCDLFQGFGLSRPLHVERVAALLSAYQRDVLRVVLAGASTQPVPLFES